MKALISLLVAALLLATTVSPARAELVSTGWLTGEQYQAYYNTHPLHGLVPIAAEAGIVEGQLRFAAVFNTPPHGVNDWATHHGMTDADFAQTNQNYLNQGFQLHQHQRFTENGYRLNQGIWYR